jgi:GLPGLI family protein
MRKPLTLFFFCLAGLACYAQLAETPIASVRYEFIHVIDTTMPDQPFKQENILWLGKKSSLYTTSNLQQAQMESLMKGFLSKNPEMAPKNGITFYYGAPYGVYKNTEENTLDDIAKMKGNNYIIEEPIPVIDWKITQETKDLKGYACQKATAFFRGRNYEAWFCSKIPYNNGPWKLAGLPGLILEAYDTKREVVFTFKSFEDNITGNEQIVLPNNPIKTNFKDLMRAIQASQNVQENSSNAGAMVSSDGTSLSKNIGKKKFNNPIEKNVTY